MAKKYHIGIIMTQETDGIADNSALVDEYSDDPKVHVWKTKVFTDCFTRAINEATQKLTDMALAEIDGKGPKV